MNKIIEALLYPLTELVGWLVMRDMRRWARGYRMETEPQGQPRWHHRGVCGPALKMKTTTKINILIAIEALFCLGCAVLLPALLLPGTWAFIAIPMVLIGVAAALFLGVCITRRLLGLNWRDSWAHFKAY